jgi:PAS domain S-box-containing protein
MWNAALVQSSADSIIGMSTGGVIQSWNEASSRLYGYSATEALDQDAASFLARDPSERKRLLARVAAGDERPQIESQDLGKDGGVIDVSVTDSPIRDAEPADRRLAQRLGCLPRAADPHALRRWSDHRARRFSSGGRAFRFDR